MIIIYKEPNKDGKLVFTKEELEALLEQARQEGYKEGKKDVIIPSIQPASPYLQDKPFIVGVNQKPDSITQLF